MEIPFESQVDRAALKRRGGPSHILSAIDVDRLVKGGRSIRRSSRSTSSFRRLPLQTISTTSHRLTRELRKSHQMKEVSVDFRMLKKLFAVLRAADWCVTVTIVLTRKGYTLINVEPGNTEEQNYSIVIDIGTTTVCGQLLDLARCRAYGRPGGAEGTQACTLAETADYNAQISYGEDVISRIVFSQKGGGLKRLQEVVVSTINGVIGELLSMSGVTVDQVSHLVFAGNTTMTHLVLGLDPKYIMLDPYTPTANFIPPVRAINIGLNVGDHVVHLHIPLRGLLRRRGYRCRRSRLRRLSARRGYAFHRRRNQRRDRRGQQGLADLHLLLRGACLRRGRDQVRHEGGQGGHREGEDQPLDVRADDPDHRKGAAGGHLRVGPDRRGRRAFRGGHDRPERQVRPRPAHAKGAGREKAAGSTFSAMRPRATSEGTSS